MKKILSAMLALLAVGGCNSVPEGISTLPQNTQSEQLGMSDFEIAEETDAFSNECDISLGETVNINGEGAVIDDNCITISESGIYKITGTLENGMIYIGCKETVKLVFDNAGINNDNGSAIISESEKLIIECEADTTNFLSDGKEYTYKRSFENAEKHEATLYAEGKLLLAGKGKLSVSGNYSESITAGELTVKGNLQVDAEDNGIIADGGISCLGAHISLTAEKDGMKTDSSISAADSSITISAENDGIQAESELNASGVVFDISTSGDIESDSELSSKGIKAGKLVLSDCTVTVNSTDHSVKSDGTADISGGEMVLSSSMGKGITAEGALTVNDAEITVLMSNEGIESKSTLTINSGNLNITSTDDGINTGGDDMTSDHSIIINGGTVVVNAEGDGLDSNGDIAVNGGVVVVYGPVSAGNSPLDWGEMGFSLKVTGGKVLAMGDMGMMMNTGSDCFMSSSLNAKEGDVITVADSNGNVIISAVTPKSAQGIIFSGVQDCRVYKNGTVDGTADEYGIITSGTVTGGTEIEAGMAGGFGGKGGRHPQDFPTGKPDREIPQDGMPAIPEDGMPMMPVRNQQMENGTEV